MRLCGWEQELHVRAKSRELIPREEKQFVFRAIELEDGENVAANGQMMKT